MTIDEHIARLRELKDLLVDYNAAVSNTRSSIAERERMLIEAMQIEGIDKAATNKGSASIKVTQLPTIKDWPTALDFINDGHRDLLTKKVNSACWRALLESGVEVPGVEPYEKTTLNFNRKD